MANTTLQVKASAPGSLFLMGEYAVLEGGQAVLMTLKHRLKVALSASDILCVSSDRFGIYDGAGEKPQHVTLCENILKRFAALYEVKLSGVQIDVMSSIPTDLGFASSAALIAALVKALHDYHGVEQVFEFMFEIGHGAIRDTFGRGSGADLAAALADMPFVTFNPETCRAVSCDLPFSVQAIYTGYKTPTPVVLQRVKESVPTYQWKETIEKMKDCAARFVAAPSVDLVREYQEYMDSLGVSCDSCRDVIGLFEAQGVVAKISGSGMGDCVVGFADHPLVLQDIEQPYRFLSQKDLAA